MRDHNTRLMRVSVSYFIKAALLAAQWVGGVRKREMSRIAKMGTQEKDAEILFLRDRVRLLEAQLGIRVEKEKKKQIKPHYTNEQKLTVVWNMFYFGLARSRVSEYFGVSRS